jgi:phosphatidylserine/phosphatidylglycerophosphate/cardiolipin synthase-like enzyme
MKGAKQHDISPDSTHSPLSRRAYQEQAPAYSWEEIFEAGPYYERVSSLLEAAQHYAIFVGWQIDSRLRLTPQESFKQKILRLVEQKPDFHFYFLVWDHAYFYVFERESWQGRVWDELHPHVHFVFDNRHPFGGSHHEKVCIIDGTTAFCGGIDLCDDRWDSPQHLFSDPRRSLKGTREKHGPYHDIAVQVTGPVCGQIQTHVRSRWEAISNIPFPALPPRLKSVRPAKRPLSVYLSRTQLDIDGGGKKPITREIEFLFRDLIRKAEKRIILEGQYYWSPEINELLISKLIEKTGLPFEIVLILSDTRSLRLWTRKMTQFELSLLKKLQETARITGGKLIFGSPYVFPSDQEKIDNPFLEPKPVYIHSKVIVVDDQFLSIGSANLATRAMRLDTEINLTLEANSNLERNHIRCFAEMLLKHWNIGGESLTTGGVRLVAIRAAWELKKYKPCSKRWKYLFDPSEPWLYPIARRLRRVSRSKFDIFNAFSIFLLWSAFTLVITVLAAHLQSINLTAVSPWAYAFTTSLLSIGLSPVSFTAVAILAGFKLGPDLGITTSMLCIWSVTVCGYWITRLFPSVFNTPIPAAAFESLNSRRFPEAVSVSLNPKISLRKKIAYQGLSGVPFAWFFLNMILVLPAALYVGLKIIYAATPPLVAQSVQASAPVLFTLLNAYAMARIVIRSRQDSQTRKSAYEKRTSTRSLLQHSQGILDREP